jgi:hypothetical protein
MPAPSRGLTCYYELDQRLVVRSVGADWDRFAIENGAPELVSPNPVGRPLWMFLTDATTVHLYEVVFRRVAVTRRSVTFPVRCDGASRRQFFSLTASPGSVSGFAIASVLVRSEPRQAIHLFERSVKRRKELLRVCSWCQRVEVAGRWFEVEDALLQLRLFERDSAPTIASCTCERCERFMLSMLTDDSILPSY